MTEVPREQSVSQFHVESEHESEFEFESESESESESEKILFVDEDRELLELLSFVAQRAGFRPLLAADPATAWQLFTDLRPRAVVLDTMVGDGCGLRLLNTIRRSSDVPVIVLSTSDAEDDVVHALELGADDYVTKPIPFRALMARIHAVLRRRQHQPRPTEPVDRWLRVGPLAVNPRTHKATLDGLPLSLTGTEFRLLHLLMDNPGCTVPHQMLLQEVWSSADPTATDVVRAAVSRLRRKLSDASEHPPLLRTIPGVGVILDVRSAAPVAA
jgi:DNA-binding response OmpR family regulator